MDFWELVTNLSNNANYASYVNDGHRMDKHFVPHLTVEPSSGLLQIDMSKPGGMMVGTKTTYVEGLHMSDAGIEAYKHTVKVETEKAVNKLGEMLK